jgi:hypothetical protein
MTSKLRVSALIPCIALLVACGGPPKQAEVADIEGGSGVDMAPSEGGSEGQSAGTAPEEGEMRAKCCAECKAGLAKDRTGTSPDTIPCADFTDTLSPWCLEHFRAHPVMASKCE